MAPAPKAPLGSRTNPVIIDVWMGMDPLRGVNMDDFWNRTLNQVHIPLPVGSRLVGWQQSARLLYRPLMRCY